MQRIQLLLTMCLGTLVCSACSSVLIEPISASQAEQIHHQAHPPAGYVVYAPMIVVEISQEQVCVNKDDKGHCTSQETRCTAGKPFTLPDYERPYRVSLPATLGKAGADISISDGWRLGSVKDNTDHLSALAWVQKLWPLSARTVPGAGPAKSACSAAGLYRLQLDQGQLRLQALLAY